MTRERFPSAHRLLSGETFDAVFRELAVPPSAFCIVVTRGHAMDQECLDFALSTNQDSGIWGGTSEEERRMLRREFLARRKAVAV